MALKKAIRKVGTKNEKVDPAPACAFGLVVSTRISELEKGFERVESKINGLIFAVVLTAIVEIARAVLR